MARVLCVCPTQACSPTLGRSNQCTLYLHFGMTGAIHIRGAKSVAYVNVKADEEGSWPPRFVKMQVATDCGTSMAFSDPRRLGKIWLHVSGPTPIDKLGEHVRAVLPSAPAVLDPCA